jgi:L-galactonate 5-dehydrogenase
MKAFFVDQPGETSIGSVADPKPGPEEVLLRVRLAGYCGSDLSTFRGKNPLVSYPRIPGHEIAATIEEAGVEVPERFAVGESVTVEPYTSCGDCPSCRRGRANACQFNETLGVQRDGALTEFLTVPWQKLHLAGGLSLRELSLVEPLSVGFHAASRGRVTKDDTVVVLGCGAIGLGAVSAAAFRGAKTIVVDIDDEKIALAQKAGASIAINSREQDLHERLQELTDGAGPDVIIEAIGLPLTFKAAVEEVAFTGRVVYIGYAKDKVDYETRLFVQKELDIMGSRNAEPADFDEVIAMLQAGKYPVDETITRVVPFDGAAAALKDWNANPPAFTKILVEVS